MRTTSGRLLVAEPMLGDPNFHRTVVLVLEHSADGALGLVLNRPTDITVSEALPRWAGVATPAPLVHVGGPVEEQSGWCLARVRHPHDQAGFVPVLGDVGLLDLELDPDEVGGELLDVRLYAGCSGWGAGQLESELAEDAWFVLDADPGDPFLADSSTLWRVILDRQPGRLGWLANSPPHPSMN